MVNAKPAPGGATKRKSPKRAARATKRAPASAKELREGDIDPASGWLVGHRSNPWCHWRVTQAQLAECLELSERQIQNLEAKGLPHEGHRSTKLYPFPDAHIWYCAYKARLAVPNPGGKARSVDWLDPRITRAEHELVAARESAEIAAKERRMYGRELTDHEFEQLADREQWLEGNRFLVALLAGKPRPFLRRAASPSCDNYDDRDTSHNDLNEDEE